MAEWFHEDVEDLRTLIGKTVKRRREALGMSQYAAAAKAGISSQAAWSLIEIGANAKLEIYAKAADALGRAEGEKLRLEVVHGLLQSLELSGRDGVLVYKLAGRHFHLLFDAPLYGLLIHMSNCQSARLPRRVPDDHPVERHVPIRTPPFHA